MRKYSKVLPRFWSGNTGKTIRGDPNAQRVAFYLMTCGSSNMLGMYYLPLPTLLHEIGISLNGASGGLQRLAEAGFSYYDKDSEYVFVVEMAAHQIEEELEVKDSRVRGIIKEIELHRKCPYFNLFLLRYAVPFHLQSVKKNTPPVDPPSTPLPRQEQEQEQEQEQKREPLAISSPGSEPKYSEAFEHFWQKSTRRGSKLEAGAEWKKLRIEKNPAVHENCLVSMILWQQTEQWQDETKQPHVFRWLKRRGWEEKIPRSNGNGRHAGDIEKPSTEPHPEHHCAFCDIPHDWVCEMPETCGMPIMQGCPGFASKFGNPEKVLSHKS